MADAEQVQTKQPLPTPEQWRRESLAIALAKLKELRRETTEVIQMLEMAAN